MIIFFSFEVEEQEIKRKEKELVATVKLPAEAESYKVETIAQGRRTQVRSIRRDLAVCPPP